MSVQSKSAYEECLTQIRQQLVKENFVGDIDLSHLEPDFFRNINGFRKNASKEQLKVLDAMLNQLLRKRTWKLLHFVYQSDTKKIHYSLTDEEMFFWESISHALKELQERVLRHA